MLLSADHTLPPVSARTARGARPVRTVRRRIELPTIRTFGWSIAVATMVASVSVVVSTQIESQLGPDPVAATEAAVAAPTSTARLESSGLMLALADGSATITGRLGAPVSLTTSQVGDLAIEQGQIDQSESEVTRTWDGATEWYRSVDGGFEHGYTIDAPVSSTDSFDVVMNVVGGEPILRDGDVAIVRPDAPVMAYRDLVVFDADGDKLPAELGVDADMITITVDASGAVYPITIDPIVTEVERVDLGVDAAPDDFFGRSIDIDGNRMVVGAPGADDFDTDAGAAYVYERIDELAPWVLTATLTMPAASPYLPKSFGSAVAVHGDQVAVGDPLGDPGYPIGRVWFFDYDQGLAEWGDDPFVVRSDLACCEWKALASDGFGYSVDFIDVDRIVIGAPLEAGQLGRIYELEIVTDAIEFEGFRYPQLTDITPTPVGVGTADDELGFSVAAAPRPGGGYRIVAGAPGAEADSGAVLIFEDDGLGFAWDRKFSGYTPAGRRVGTAVDIFGDRIVVGETGDQTAGATLEVQLFEWKEVFDDFTETFVFDWDVDTIIRYGPLGANVAEQYNDYLAIEGGTVAVGRPGSGGSVDLYRFDGEAWPALPDNPSDTIEPAGREAGDAIGSAVGLDGHTLVMGATGDDSVAPVAVDSGAAYSAQIPLVATALEGAELGWASPTTWDVELVPGAGDAAIVPVFTYPDLYTEAQIGRFYVAGSLNLVEARLTETGLDAGSVIAQTTVVAGELPGVYAGELYIDYSELELIGGLQVDGYLSVGEFASMTTGAGVFTGSGVVDNQGFVIKDGPGELSIGASLEWFSSDTSVFEVQQGDVTVGIDAFASDGRLTVRPGSTMTFNSGLLLQSTSVVEFDIGGPPTDPANFGRIVVAAGTFTAAGTIAYPFSEIQPEAGDVFPVLECPDCRNGSFDVYDTNPLDVILGATDISLAVLGNKLVNPTFGGFEFPENFGFDVDVDGDWAVVMEPNFGSEGIVASAHVLSRDIGTGAWSVEQTIVPFVYGYYGELVAIEGDILAISGGGESGETEIYTRDAPGASFVLLDTVVGGGDVAISGNRVLVGNPYPQSELDVPSATVYRIDDVEGSLFVVGDTTLYPDGELTVPSFGQSVAIDGGQAVVGSSETGSAYVFGSSVEGFNSSPIATLTSPDGPGNQFGISVAIDGDRIVIGEPLNSDPSIHMGAAWVYESPTSAPTKLAASDGEGADQFGIDVALSGETILVGASAAQKFNFPMRDGNAYVFQLAGTDWVETQILRVPDGANGDQYGRSVAIGSESMLVGAPTDLNYKGPNAGAVYWFDVPGPVGQNDPTIELSISASNPTPKVGVSSISVSELPASAFQGYGGTAADYSAPELQTLDLKQDLGAPDGGETPVADVTLMDLGLDQTPITRGLLASISLAEIPIEGGWSARLQPGVSAENRKLLVEQSISLLDVYEDYPAIADDVRLGELSLGTSNLGAISTYAALLAGVPVTSLPSPDASATAAQYWCGEVLKAGLDCESDFAAASAPTGLTLPVLSFAGVDIDGSALLGVALSGVDLDGTPIGDRPLGTLNLGVVPLALQPLVPSKSLPSFLPSTVVMPDEFLDITLGELGGAAPLAALTPADVGLDGAPLSNLDLTFLPESPLRDYQNAPSAVGASLLLSSEAPLSTAVSGLPVKALGLNAPILSVPLDELILPNGRVLGEVLLSDLLADTSPFGASPFGASPFGASPFGASPFGASPFGASPFGASPFGASPFGASPFGASPFGASPFGASPFGASPFGASPFGASPFGASPFGASPFGASPFGASPLSDLGLAVPVSAVPLDGMVNGRQLGSYRLDELDPSNLLFDLPVQVFVGSDLFDCTKIDCRQPNGFTIGDAIAAEALSGALTLADVQLGLFGLTMGDLVGAHLDFTLEALTAFVDDLGPLTVAAAEAAGLGVSGIPIQLLSAYDTITIQEARLLFSGWRLVDLAGLAVGLEAADLEAAVSNWNSTLTVGELTRKLSTDDSGGLGVALWVDTLALSTVAQAFEDLDTQPSTLTVDDVWSLLAPLRLEHLRIEDIGAAALTPTAALRTIGDTLAVSPSLPDPQNLEGLLWGDIIGSAGTDPLPSAGDLTVADVVDSFAGITLGEFLRAAQPITDQQTEQIDLRSIDLAAYSDGPVVSFSIDIQVDGVSAPDGARIVATLPAGSRYVDGSARLNGADEVEPTLLGDTLVWQLSNLQPGIPYTLSFDTRSSAQTGIVVASTTAQLASANVFARADTTIEYIEALEPNDVPNDSGVITVGPDQIILSQVGTETDVDMFRFEVTTPGTLIGGELWDLPADYDLTIVGPSAEPLSETGGRVLESVNDSQAPLTGGAATATLSDAGNYQPPAGLAVIARSTGRGTSDESIQPIPTFVVGTYYLVVTGYDGATSDDSYALRLSKEDLPLQAPECANDSVSFPFPNDGADAAGVSIPDEANTLFVINHERFGKQYGAAEADNVLDEIDSLSISAAFTDRGLVAGVLDLGATPGLAMPLQQWDDVPCDLSLANAVVRSTVSTLRGVYAVRPDIEYVVIVGSDKIVPFARLADRTLLGNEQNYASTFGGDVSTPLYAALAGGTFFSDDPYVDTTPNLVNDRALYVPERSVGRLVEDPDSIIGQLASFTGTIRTENALVTGYDFVSDAAVQISDRLSTETGQGDPFVGPVPQDDIVELISDDWSAGQLDALLFPQGSPSAGIGVINGHFSHQGTQSAFGSANDDQGDALFVTDIGTTDFTGALLYTLGCHSGLSVSENAPGDLAADWAENFARSGAAAYLAQSGFGYGSSDSVQLTEQLLALFSARLDGNFTIGQALQLAKNDYIGPLSSISVYDEKSVQQAILYGLPFSTPDVAPENLPPAPEAPADLAVIGTDLFRTTLVEDVDFAVSPIQRVESTGGSTFEIDGRSYAPQGSPLQPIASIDTTAADEDLDGVPDSRLHGALLLAGSAYLVDGLIDPVYQTPSIDSSLTEPEAQPPDARYPITPLGVSDQLTEFGLRDVTVITPSRFRATLPDGRGTQALYDDLTIETLHSGSTDWVAPTVGTVRHMISGNQLTVTVTSPSGDVAGVVVAIVENLPTSTETNPTTWDSFELASNGGSWSGTYELGSCTEQLRFLVQIFDDAGNVNVSSNKASDFATSCVPGPAPELSASPSTGVFSGDVTVNVTTNVTRLSYQINGGDSVSLSGTSFTITDEGITNYVVSGGGLSVSGQIRIDRIPPTVTITSPAENDVFPAGTPIAFVYTCIDPSIVSCEGVLTGPGPAVDVAAGEELTLAHRGMYDLMVTGTDGVSATEEAVSFEVTPVAPTIDPVTGITGPTQPELIGTTSTISVVFTDPELETDDYTIEFDFGKSLTGAEATDPCVATSAADGVTDDATCSLVEPTANAPGTATASIVYPSSGVYTVTVTITDDSGLSTVGEHSFVVVFDPGGGRVSGAGQFVSDESAYFGDGPDGSAKTSFGFKAKYDDDYDDDHDDGDDDEDEHDDGLVPEGKTKLKVKHGLKFKSTAYEYLVINDTYAVAEGVGKVNGVAGFRMRVQAIDNGNLDFFQITIWNPDTGDVVYDNGVMYNTVGGNVDGNEVTKGNIKVKA